MLGKAPSYIGCRNIKTLSGNQQNPPKSNKKNHTVEIFYKKTPYKQLWRFVLLIKYIIFVSSYASNRELDCVIYDR